MFTRLTLCAAIALSLSAPSFSQSAALSFPLDYAGYDDAASSHRMVNNTEAILQMELYQAVRLIDVPTPQGDLIEVDLERVSINNCKFGFRVDDQPRPDLLNGLGLTVWSGTVVGSPNSEVMMSFSLFGTRGWIKDDGQVTHLMPSPSGENDWARSWTYIVDEQELLRRGNSPGNFCQSDALLERPVEAERSPFVQPNQNLSAGAVCSGYECSVAVETDYQLFQVFGNLNAMTTYVTTLLAYGSSRYVGQINTTLVYPYLQFYTSSSDPWGTQDSGGSSVDLLYEFQAAWAGNVPNDCVLGHFLSGAGLGGGVAWLDVLCNNTYNFGVSGNINGNLNFPVVQAPNQWDAMVWIHEIGHNFDAVHTHDYCPPLDECAPSGYFGSCQTSQICTSSGTIMSYCHLCSGGTSNVTTYFHPTSASYMQAAAASCLPGSDPASVDVQSIAAPGVPITITAFVGGTPVPGTNPVISYGYNGNFGSTLNMTDQGGGNWSAALPAASCGDQPQLYVTYFDTNCGQLTVPSTAPSDFFTIQIGVATQIEADDLEAASGWVAGDPSDTATTGAWVRVDPIGTAAQPDDDHTTAGSQCFVTGQGSNGGSLGENDVDGGTTTLYSPTYDLSGSIDPVISYWRWYSNDAGAGPNADAFIVQISNNDGSNWSTVETVGPNGAGTSGGWIQHTFHVNDIVAATASIGLRFLASDLNAGSIIEAGVDDLEISDFACNGGGGVGTNYCQSGPNGAAIGASGSVSVSANNLDLLCDSIPNNTFGLFYFGNGAANSPLGNGTRCVAINGATTRLGPPINSGSSGTFARGVNLPTPTAGGSVINPGSTWYFQAWFRDGSSSDLSDGLQIDFTP
jgi:hypothetical protein